MSVEIVKKYLVVRNSWVDVGDHARTILGVVDNPEEAKQYGTNIDLVPLVSDIIHKFDEPMPNLNYREIGNDIKSAVLTCQRDKPVVLRLVMSNNDTWILSISMTQIVSPAKDR